MFWYTSELSVEIKNALIKSENVIAIVGLSEVYASIIAFGIMI